MHNVKKKGFTLIELIAVLVIMAIIALIATPLVMSIIRHAKLSADKRSIDAYGRSIELAIAGYLMDNGSFPTSIEQLTIEYSGDEVVCSTTQLNTDSSVYLAGCTVGGRSVDNYTYGTDKSPSYQTYSVGDTVTYNNIDFYVIKDSGAKEDTVLLLKSTPITSEEINRYGQIGAGCPGCYIYTAADEYGNMGCGQLYDSSNLKKVVDAWVDEKLNNQIVKASRLITYEELVNDFGYTYAAVGTSMVWKNSEDTPTWIYDNDYCTMSIYEDSDIRLWIVNSDGTLTYDDGNHKVRPVIVLSKSALN